MLFSGNLGKSRDELRLVTFPVLVDSDGKFVSHVQEEHNIDATDKQSKGLLHLEVPTFEGKKLRLRLSKNRQFIAPGLVIEKEGQVKYYHPECHYEGHVIDQPNSSVSISYCRGLVSAKAAFLASFNYHISKLVTMR